jgi:3-oxoadipate CoA-transferase alpha subunit
LGPNRSGGALGTRVVGRYTDGITRFEETPRMINKIVQTMADTMAGIKDGSVVLLGGFGSVGQPNALIDGLIEHGATDLVVAANNAGAGHVGLARLMELGRVRKIICSFPRSSDPVVFETLYRAGKIELEIVPQGTLAERMRAAGAGVPAFFTATGVGTKMAVGKEHRDIDGRTYILEQCLKGDVALVEAWEADRWGNLTFKQAGRNFNPVCAMAAELTLVQTQHIRELGEIDPDHVVTPGIFVDRVLHVPYGDPSGF